MEGLYRLVELLQQQWQVLRQVFGIFIVAVLMVGAAIYLVLDWHYAGTDLAQKATIKLLEAQVAQRPQASVVLPPPVIPTAEVTNLRSLSDQDLATSVIKLTGDLRSMDVAYSKEEQTIFSGPRPSSENDDQKQRRWQEQAKLGLALTGRRDSEWQLQYRPKARAYYEEMCRRLAIVPDPPPQTAMLSPFYLGQAVISDGMLAGVHPLSALADFLNSLAHRLG